MHVKELRIIMTVENLDEVIRYYRDTVGLKTSKGWDEPTGQGIILEAGRASLELIDNRHAATIDQLEVGSRIAGTVRLAFNVGPDLEKASHGTDYRWGSKTGRLPAGTLEQGTAT